MIYEGFSYEKIHFPTHKLLICILWCVPCQSEQENNRGTSDNKTQHRKKVVNDKRGGLKHNKIRILKAPWSEISEVELHLRERLADRSQYWRSYPSKTSLILPHPLSKRGRNQKWKLEIRNNRNCISAKWWMVRFYPSFEWKRVRGISTRLRFWACWC